jgi:tryptophan synthase beta chain
MAYKSEDQPVGEKRRRVAHDLPDRFGRFGAYGGRYVPEVLLPAVIELETEYLSARNDDDFQSEFEALLRNYVGRPTPLTHAGRLSEQLGLDILIKREDLCHTGAHKINNAIGQILLARRMGKRRIIAETGAGQHGVATATVCAHFGMECVVYMGEVDIERQHLNVLRMELLGARVEPVTSGTRTLKDAANEAIRDWVTNVATTHYIIGSVIGPHPYPMMVRDFHRVIGLETAEQLLAQRNRSNPDAVFACVGGGSNAIGIFSAFVDEPTVRLFGSEAAGRGLDSGLHAASLTLGRPGVLHGFLSYLLQNDDGQVLPVHSISAGLDYPGVGPEHAYLKDAGRVEYAAITDEAALAGLRLLAQTEGIIPALETAHAVAHLIERAHDLQGMLVVLNCSGRGDKDLGTIAASSNLLDSNP